MKSIIIIVVFCCALVGVAIEAKSVTYDQIGTFTDQDFFNVTCRPVVVLPETPEEIHPTFLLFTHKTKHNPENLTWNGLDEIRKSHFNGSNPTKMIVHGFIDNTNLGPWMQKFKDRLLENGDFNVIIVDWGRKNGPTYSQAVANTRVVGPMIAILIQHLSKIKNTTPERFHILGHSLGSHIAGSAGKFLKGKLGHITGLDPAGPLYEGCQPEARLWHTDAKFVEAIHTDSKAFIPYIGLGMNETCGHVDFFPNNGVEQPGCFKEKFTSIIRKGLFEGSRRIVACNHQRAVDFYIASLEHKNALPVGFLCQSYEQFLDGKCQDCGKSGEKCAIMGLQTPEWRRSVRNLGNGGKRFFMMTGSDDPFFLPQYALNVKMSSKNVFEYNGKMQFNLTNQAGKSESVDFNSDAISFQNNQTYSKVILVKENLGKLSKVGLKWSPSGFNIIGSKKIFIESVQIVSMSGESQNHNRTAISIEKFCNSRVGDGVDSGQSINLERRC